MKKCPKCEKIITSVTIDDVNGCVLSMPTWKTISYQCPYCNTVLGVQIDPVAIKTDIVNEIVKALKGF